MEINSARLIGITHFRQHTSSTIDEVAAGKTFHLMRDNEVIGHIVPPNALVIDNENLEFCLLGSVIDPAADHFALSVINEGYLEHIGDDVGRVFAWLWNSNPTKAVRWVSYYTRRFTGALRGQHYSRPTFDQLWFAVSRGLSVTMRAAEIDDFGRVLRTELPNLNPGLFTPAELAGNCRPRDTDDPWPDAEPNGPGRGYTKRRWHDLEVGQFIPDPTRGHTLPDDEHWCRIASINAAEAVLEQPDATPIHFTVPDLGTWLPVVGHMPYYWQTIKSTLRA
ncbi:hypothetical protein A7G45_31140 [Mycolicibacterium llatzerense]|nr:hypothetical protein [Mycolicibacterium llatzerense]